jgi:hypothetical protein
MGLRVSNLLAKPAANHPTAAQLAKVETITTKSIQSRVTLFIFQLLRPFGLVPLLRSALSTRRGKSWRTESVRHGYIETRQGRFLPHKQAEADFWSDPRTFMIGGRFSSPLHTALTLA